LEPSSTNGFPVTLYSIETLPQNNTAALKTVFFVAGTVYEYTFLTGVTAGVDYKFRVTAYNSIGVGESAETSSSVKPYTIPERPVITVRPGDRSALVSWTMPMNTGLPILRYIVTITPGIGINPTTETVETSKQFLNLNNGTAYSFSVYARNELGNGLVGYTPYTVIPFIPQTTNTSQLTLPKWFTRSGRR
jgi:hypothetical protein